MRSREMDFVPYELGELLRKSRLKEGITQEELADELGFSTATLSKIERGTTRVSKAKLIRICTKFNINYDEYLSRYVLKQEKVDELNLDLLFMVIEHDLNMINPEKAWGKIRKLDLNKDDPTLTEIMFLKGKYYERIEKWNEAQEHYQKALRLVDRHQKINTNIKAASFNGLSRLHNHLNNLDQALSFVQQGLKCFVEDGERKYVKYHLFISKIAYLEKLNRDDEALAIIEKIWPHKEEIESTEAHLNLYQARAELYNKNGLYEQAIHYAREGIEKARIDRMYDRSFELWSTLGESYSKKGNFSNAEICFKSALELETKIRRKYLLVSTYTLLGRLYLETGDIQIAKNILKTAIKWGENTKDDFRLIEALVAMGDCFVEQNLNIDANNFYKQALEIAEKHSFLHQQSDILMKLAKNYEDTDLGEYKKCVEKHFIVAVQLRERRRSKMRVHEQLFSSKLDSSIDPPDD